MATLYETDRRHARRVVDRAAGVLRRDGPARGRRARELSPKGMAGRSPCSTRIASPTSTTSAAASRRWRTCARTAAIVVMFCAFDGPPKIVRLHGTGRAVLRDDAGVRRAARRASRRTASTACARSSWSTSSGSPTRAGSPSPLMDFVSDRDVLDQSQSAARRTTSSDYAATRNATSIDGLPGLDP